MLQSSPQIFLKFYQNQLKLVQHNVYLEYVNRDLHYHQNLHLHFDILLTIVLVKIVFM